MSHGLTSETESHSNPAGLPPSSDATDFSSGRWWKLGSIGIVVVLILSLSAAAWFRSASPSRRTSAIQTHTVTRGDLVVTVTAEGKLESSKNTEIKCQIRGGYGGRGGMSTVNWIIPAGSIVKQGDELVRLDTKVIEETVSLGKTDTNNAKAELARAEADLAKAEIAVDSYLSGRYRSQMKALEKELEERKRNLRVAEEMMRESQLMFQKGYMSELEVEGNKYSVTQAELELNVTETRIDVLSRLTKAMELETLNGQLTAAKARVEGRRAGVALEQGRLDLAQEEFDRSTIRAPRDGLVIYPSTAKWKDSPDVVEGASVHNNQVLLIMPDLTQMQVKVGVHESIIDRIQPGMAAKVVLPTQTLDTTVSSVASVATPAGWWTGNAVNYDVTIKLPSKPGLNPGMSADVEVVVARYNDVLSVPTAVILETDQGHFCWVRTPEGLQRREVQLGDSNDEFIIVESGLSENEQIVLDPLISIEDARDLVTPSTVHTIEQADLVVSLTEQGILESSNNTEIKCKVRGASTVNWVIESGTEVDAGDELVRLENKQIEEYLHQRTKFAFLSKDASIGFRAQATRAGLAISEYLEGQYRTELLTQEKDLAIAEQRLATAQNMLRHARMLFERGYTSELEVEQKGFTVQEAQLDVDIKRIGIDVLKRFTKAEQLETLKGNWEAAKAAANGHEEVLKMDETRIALAMEEMERSVIKAPRAGLVIYPEGEEWKDTPEIAEGVTVHHDQILLLMPDLSRMQVRVGVYESMVDRIKPGMAATVTVPGKTLQGKVVSVAAAAKPAAWWTGNIVKYDAVIQLPSEPGLKPGMTAEVEIIMAQHENVLTIPVSAVVETEEGSFCWVGTPEDAQQRSLQLGDGNDNLIVVESGLQQGEQVVLYPSP